MNSIRFLSIHSVIGAVALTLLPSLAHATQPLDAFIAGAKTQNYDARELRVTTEQRQWEAGAALGRLLPNFVAQGSYTRNQYETAIQLPGSTTSMVITPKDQLDAILQLNVPIIDVSSYYRYRQARQLAQAAELQEELASSNIDGAVARVYFSYIGASALAESAQRSLAIAEANAALVQTRREAGVAMDLDVARAKANVERSKQDLADSQLMRQLSARSLETLTGVTPTPVTDYPEDNLHAEASLERWMAISDTPTTRLQKKLDEVSLSGKRAAATALLPTVSASAQERFTNATGFTGHNSVYTLQLVAQWRLDYGTYASARAQSAAVELQRIRAEQASRSNQDAIYEAYQRVSAGIAKSQAARAQSAAAADASALASQRYEAGVATQLDVTQAQRDAFQAEAARIQADAELVYARASLRVAAGAPITAAAPSR